MSWSFAVSKCADCLSRFVFKPFKHLVHLSGAKGEHEPFSRNKVLVTGNLGLMKSTLN